MKPRKLLFSLLGVVVFALGWELQPFLVPRVFGLPYSNPVSVSPPTQMRPWQFIVIHHSGAQSGNEASIQQGHLQRGMENGMAYHFLIGNGSMKLEDGKLIEGHRWKYQLQGGHSHQETLNEVGIGICLVGNFKKKPPTPKQLQTLCELICRLQKEFQIPNDRVHGHGQFFGEDTDCPGNLFPWQEFHQHLDLMYPMASKEGERDRS